VSVIYNVMIIMTEDKPADIPNNPERTYKKEWKGWGNWLGTELTKNIEYRGFEEARKFVHSLGLKSKTEWDAYCRTGKMF